MLKKRLSRDIDFSKSGLEQLSAAGDIFVKFLKEKPFYAALILQFEKTVLEEKETGKKILLVEPVLEILKNVLENGISDQTLRDDIQPKELVTILWSQMLGILNTLSGRKELFTIYKIDENWIIRGHFRVIMRGMKPKEG